MAKGEKLSESRAALVSALLDDAKSACDFLRSIMHDDAADISLRLRAANAILDKAGFGSATHRAADAQDNAKPLTAMTPGELQEHVRRAREELKARSRGKKDVSDLY